MQTDIIQAELPHKLAIDIGTSSIRALLFDRLGRCLPEATSRQPLKLVMGKDGRADIITVSLAESCWHCIDETLEKIGDTIDDVSAVAMCTFVSNLIGVDREYQPVTPIYPYADTRPSKVIPGMRSIFDEEQLHQRTGCVLHASYLPTRFI